MPPVRTAKGTPAKKWRSPYETPVIKIVIGEEEAVFKLNEGLLQSTSFFAKEKRLHPKRDGGPPSNPSNENMRQSAEPANAKDSYFSDTSEQTTDPDEDVATIDLTIDDADFILKGKFYHTRDAFSIFVRSLNDALPIKPQSQQDCHALFRAYAIAQEYDFEKLQNETIGALQSFYVEHTIPVTDLFYLAEHWGDRVECVLARYLIAQAAHEMASDWSSYLADNKELERLYAGGLKVIMGQLFQAAMQYAQPTKVPAPDPAKQKRFWRFPNT